jgi:hypothetical protein
LQASGSGEETDDVKKARGQIRAFCNNSAAKGEEEEEERQ